MKNVIIIGTGGHAKVVADIVICSGDNLLGFLTTDQGLKTFAGKPVLGGNEDYVHYPDCYFLVGIGNPDARERITKAMEGVRWYTAIHPTVVISPLETAIGEGSVLCVNSVVVPGASVGRHCIVNTFASVDHDCVMEDYSHVSAGVRLGGGTHIGTRSFLGVGSMTRNNISICPDCVIGVGAAVVKNITQPGVYAGIPARKIK